MTQQIQAFDKSATKSAANEPDVEVYANAFLAKLGFTLKNRKTGNKDIDKHWPSKSTAAKGPGTPDVLVYADASHSLPFCVWENKGPSVPIATALDEAKFYIAGLHNAKPHQPGLPRVAAGFNGKQLRLAYFNHERRWQAVKTDGTEVIDTFPNPKYAANGFDSNGNFLAVRGHATASDLRKVLPALKNIYRGIPSLSSGRRPIDFTVALLTLRMLCEFLPSWGSWAEQPGLTAGAGDNDKSLKERFTTLLGRVISDKSLKQRYGDIFEFSEKTAGANAEMAFSFADCLKNTEAGNGFYEGMHGAIDTLPPLHGADFDVFGEVYQAIGDDATKKALGEFFTGRHIISAVVPILFERAGISSFESGLSGKTIADIACGTGGFLTEVLRHVRKTFKVDEDGLKDFAQKAFFGYDLSQSNASRARVNMYFAGDGFSTISGGVDSLEPDPLEQQPRNGFDLMLNNPPYGQSPKYGRLEEAFVSRIVSLLKPGSGWGLVVLPTGVLENPRSAQTRLTLLRSARITDVIALPPHAFAPYTKQRTAIVIFQKRASELGSLAWKDVIAEVGNEEISMFIVDNDGFANSDKRYETSRRAKSGEWLHNDLESWVSTESGAAQDSKLVAALLKKKSPKGSTDEFGAVLAKKYGIFTVQTLFKQANRLGSEQGRGLSLLPDQCLRPAFPPVAIAEFIKKCEFILSIARRDELSDVPVRPLSDIIRDALATPVLLSKGQVTPMKVKDAFDLRKGDQALTESVIYSQQDDKGIPVYGGGEALPRFKISKKSKTKKGVSVAVQKGPALIVAMDGSSGAVRVVESGDFCCNHHACVLLPKHGFLVDLFAVAQQLEGGLRAMASNKDSSATLTLPALSDFLILLPTDTSVLKELSDRRKSISEIRDRFFGTQ